MPSLALGALGADPAPASPPARGTFRFLLAETRALLALDVFVAVILALALGPFLASLLRHADNAAMLSAMFDDEALISLQLDGMTAWPWGNPGTYLGERGAPGLLPPHWQGVSFQNLPYYGGFYLDLALLLWAPLKLLGLPFFPTAPVVLRTLALLFTAATIVAGYNVARIHFGRIAAVLATFFIATDLQLFTIGTLVHPDSLLFFLCLLALHLAILHAREASTASLLALAVAAGLAQGTKMGGPLLVPLTALALALGARRVLQDAGWKAWLARVLRNGVFAAAVALLVFVLTTPYAVLDSYFVKTWTAWARTFSGPSPIAITTFADWAELAWQYLGTPVLAASLCGFVVPWLLRVGRERALALTLAVTLGATTFLYYALFQKYWVQLQYLVVAYWVAGLLAAFGLALLVGLVKTPAARAAGFGVLLAAGACLFLLRLQFPLMVAFQYLHWKEAPQIRIGAWMEQNLRGRQASVLADAPTYVPPQAVREYAFLGGPVRYVDLAERLPDYFVLTRYRHNWQAAKITGAIQDPWDGVALNVRLYQDLLGTSATEVQIDRPAAFATRVHSVGWIRGTDEIGKCNGSALACAPITPSRIAFLYEQERLSVANVRHVSLFRLDKDKFLAAIPAERRLASATPLASSAADGAPVADVLRGGVPWRSARQGAAAVGEYVGLELPQGMKVQPRELVIRWVAWHWCPSTFAVDYSDDGKTWSSAATLAVREPADLAQRGNGTNRWDERFELPAAGEHRFWRVRALTLRQDNFFGMERLSFR